MNGTFLDWEWIWTAHNVTRPSRLESKLGMISQWFFTTDSEALCDDITTCRYHHKHLPRTHMPPIFITLLILDVSRLLEPCAVRSQGKLRQPVEENHPCFDYSLVQSFFWQARLPSRCAFSPRINLRHGVRRINTMRFR